MKKLFFFILIGLAINSFAHPNHHRSELNLKLYDNGLFTAMLDNECINSPSTNFLFNNLKPGNHHLKVIKHYPSFYGYCTSPKIVFNGIIRIPPKSKVFAMIDLYNQYDVYSLVTDNSISCDNGNNIYFDNNNPHCENPLPPAPVCINSDFFNQLKYSIMNATFDSDKLQIAKQAIAGNGVSSKQVLELMELLTFESNKIKLAKFAYQYTFDKQNYFIVNNGFTYSSSSRELNKFISMY